jgi:hypothetical protein
MSREKERIEANKKASALLTVLKDLKPKPVPVSDEIRQWWDLKALPMLKSQVLSELHRHDGFSPRLIGFMKDGGEMGIIDVTNAMGGEWGSQRSKDATAFIHRIAALVPGTYASVFCSEVWSLKANKQGEFDRNVEKYPSLGDHPDRFEAMMFQMLHYERENNTMMQLTTMIDVLKVLGEPRRRSMWSGTKLADYTMTTDPLFGEGKMEGRFIYNEEDND